MLNTNVTIYMTGRLGLCVGGNTNFRVDVGGNAKKVNIGNLLVDSDSCCSFHSI